MTSSTTLALSIFALVATASSASAQFSIPWSTIDGGGSTSSGGTFSLSGTIGQPDCGQVMSGGNFAIAGGFWPGVGTPACPSDFNGDGSTDPDDLADYIAAFFALPPNSLADFNLDGEINPDDLADFISAFFGLPC